MNTHVQSTEDQARDIEPILIQSGWTLSLGAIAAVIEAMDTMYGPDEVKRLRHIENMALRVASSRRKGIVTDKTALDNLDAALEATEPPSIEALLAAEERLANAVNTYAHVKTLSNQALVDMALDGCFSDTTATADAVLHEMCSRLHPGWQNEDPKPEWFCVCRTPLPDSTAVCPTCFPDGMTK